jgi:hypothetical protein
MLALCALLTTPSQAVTRDLTNNEGVMGCSTYYQGRDQYRGWLIGFLNVQQGQLGLDVLRNSDQQHVFNVFDRFCRMNPNRTLYEAANYTLYALR